jgi:hypothetical protein
MMHLFQYRDPLVGVLDYIVEVSLHGMPICFGLTYWVPKELSRGHHSHCP